MQKTARKKKNTDYPFDIWEKLEILVEENGDTGIYVARVDDFDANGIVITQPDWVKGGKFIVSNTKVFVRFVKSDAMYQFPAKTRILTGKLADKLQLYGIGSIRRLQRREFVRIDYSTKLSYTVLQNLTDKDQEFKWFQSQTKNISAGGLLMSVSDQIKEGDTLLLNINDYSNIGVPQYIVAYCRRNLLLDETVLVGVEFVIAEKLYKYFKPEELNKLPVQVKDFNIQNQNKLVRFIFEEQIVERKKGLL